MTVNTLAASYFDQNHLPQSQEQDVSRAMSLLHGRAGIILGEHKREMTARTLGLRTQELKLKSVSAYLDLLERDRNSPYWDNFVNSFTINHTAFFRERHHFDVLSKFIKKRSKPVTVWCCAASTGEEPYSLAISLLEAFGNDYGISVVATDIDTKALSHARKGIYGLDRIKPVAPELLHKYFLRGSGKYVGMAMVKPQVRNIVEFNKLNLIEPHWNVADNGQKFDAIFCRNTMIYFDKPTQVKILERFVPLLKPGGLLFAGHSENFTYLTKAFRLEGQTVYSVA